MCHIILDLLFYPYMSKWNHHTDSHCSTPRTTVHVGRQGSRQQDGLGDHHEGHVPPQAPATKPLVPGTVASERRGEVPAMVPCPRAYRYPGFGNFELFMETKQQINHLGGWTVQWFSAATHVHPHLHQTHTDMGNYVNIEGIKKNKINQ